MRKKIIIAGASLVSGNRGVNALTRSIIQGLIDNIGSGKVNIEILSYTVKQEVEHTFIENGIETVIVEKPYNTKYATILTLLNILKLNGLSKWNKKLSYIDNSINKADIILDISEGDSFSDIYGVKRFIMHSNIKIQSILKKKKLILLPQTIGPFKNKLIRFVASMICKNSTVNMTRDITSYNFLLKELKVNETTVNLYPDLAFYMKPKETEISTRLSKDKDNDGLLLGLNVSALLYNGGYTGQNMFNFKTNYTELVDTIIDTFLSQDKDNKIILVPHVIIKEMPVEDDMTVCKSIHNRLKTEYPDRVLLIDKALREDEIKAVISKCDLFIGGRMHACIAGMSTGVTTLPIAYSRKFSGIWKRYNLEDFIIDPKQNTLDEALKILHKTIENRKKIKHKIIETNHTIKHEQEEMYNQLKRTINEEN